MVRIIARATLNGFVANRVEGRLKRVVKEHLDSCFVLASRAKWNSSAELKDQLRSASIISSERVVFNIKGNDFRMVAAVDYEHGVLLVKWIGTHKEYDRINPEEVGYEQGRYASPSSSV